MKQQKTTQTVQIKFSELFPETGDRELFVNTQPVSKRFAEREHKAPFTVGRMDFFMLSLVVNGDLDFVFNFGQQYDIHKNSFIALSPSTVLQCNAKSEDAKAYMVAFTAKFMAQIGISKKEIEMMSFVLSGNQSVLELSNEEAAYIASLIEELEKKTCLTDEHPYAEELIQHTFQIFLLEIATIARRYKVDHANVRLSHKQNIVFKFGGLVDQYFKNERSLKYYAGKLAITPKYLSEIVHEITGIPAGQLIDEKLVFELKFQLNNLELTVSQIAENLNFSSQSVLGKFFKRHTGLSPVEYRSTL